MSDTKKLKTYNVKKDSKLQRKKRKLEAFLNLVRQDELAPVSRKKKSGGTFEQNYKALKDELKKYQKTKSDSVDPSVFLKDDGRCALVNFSSNGGISSSTSPLFTEDILHLLLTSVLGKLAPFPLRWVKLEHADNISKTVLIEIEGLSEKNVAEMNSELSNIFSFVAEVVSPNIPFATDLSTMHLTAGLCSPVEVDYSSIFPMNQEPSIETVEPTSEYKVSKLYLLLSPIQLAMEHYPLPQSVFEQSKSEGYDFSKDSYTAVNEKSPMFAVDCEMCKTVSGKQEVTRIAIVNENLETIYHTLVKPKEEIVDYITRFSGITEKMLRNVTTTLDDVHKEMRKLLPSDAILCGQSLNCDLHGLKMIHPYVIDTSIIFNEHGVRHKKTSLKQLARIHLKESIQEGKHGHSPIEDAIATMKLVQLKLKNSLEYGDAVLSPNTTENGEEVSNKRESDVTASATDEKIKVSDLVKSDPNANENGFFSRLSRFSKKACLIGCEKCLSNYCEEIITDNVTKIVKSKPKKIIKTAADNIENYDLIVSNLFFDAENYTTVELKNEIEQAYAAFPKRTSVIILMSGVNKQPDKFKHNYCMLSIKK